MNSFTGVSPSTKLLWKNHLTPTRLALGAPGSTQLAAGGGTSATSYRAQAIRELIIQKSTLWSIGLRLLPSRTIDRMEVTQSYPTELVGNWDVPEGYPGDIEHVEWREAGISTTKATVRMEQTIESQYRGAGNTQNRINMLMAARAMTLMIDSEILGTAFAAAGATAVDVPTTEKWDGSSTGTVDIVGDVGKAIDNICNESNVEPQELQFGLIVPAKIYGTFRAKTSNVDKDSSWLDILRDSFNVEVLFTRNATFANDALLVTKGELTGVHYVTSRSDVPNTWVEVLPAVGWRWTIAKFFKTMVVPYPFTDESITTTTRICKITDILAD
jgi:hypothetical protein